MGQQKLKRKLKSNRKGDIIFFSVMTALPLLHFLVFYLGVNTNSILLAFKEYDLVQESYFYVGTKNFSRLFQSFNELTVFRVSLKNSIIMYVWSTFIGVFCSLLFSYYIYKKAPFKNVFKVLLFMPSIIPQIALITMFKQFVEGGIPSIMSELFNIEMRGLLANPDTTFSTVIFFNIWSGFGVAILLYSGAMGNISQSVTEAAEIDGISFFREFYLITLPLIYRTISTILIASIGGIFISQANLYSFFDYGAEERVSVIGYYLFKETVGSGNAGYPILSAFGLLLTAAAIIMVTVARYLFNRLGPSEE